MKPIMLTSRSKDDHNHFVTAKSVTRIGVRKETKAHNRPQRFFCAMSQHPAFMAGLLGLPTGRPVSFVAGYANPDNSATNSEIGVSTGGPK